MKLQTFIASALLFSGLANAQTNDDNCRSAGQGCWDVSECCKDNNNLACTDWVSVAIHISYLVFMLLVTQPWRIGLHTEYSRLSHLRVIQDLRSD
jgi:hypothetical protein